MPSSKPTILQILPALESGGVERGTVEVASAIAAEGRRALVASAGGRLVPSLLHAGAEHFTLPLDSKNPLRLCANAAAIAHLIRKERVNIVHARSRAPAWSAYCAAVATGAHFVTTFHGVYGLQNTFKKKYNSVMARGERVIAVSEFIAEHVRAEYGVGDSRLRVIPRGVDARIFSPGRVHPERVAQMVASWRLPEDLPVILFPGRITRWKGQDVFIEALSRLPHRRFLAVLAGEDSKHPEYRKELEALIIARGLEGHVRMAGAIQQMAEAYTLSRLVVATSLQPEAFGRVALEAQAMGRPVIAADHGGARETVVEGETGWRLPPGDAEALSMRIAQALALPEAALQRMGEAGIANARRFTTEAMCAATMKVYKEVMG